MELLFKIKDIIFLVVNLNILSVIVLACSICTLLLTYLSLDIFYKIFKKFKKHICKRVN